MSSLFVYGSLQPGGPDEHVLSTISGTWQKATVTERLLEVFWGAELGYPGLKLLQNGGIIDGHLLTSVSLDTFWVELDAF